MERFWSKVEDTGDCWEWTGCRTELGYGLFDCDGQRTRAHRFAYEEVVGLIPEGLEIDHLCRNPSCVRPEHLEAVTHRENMRRSDNANARKTHCKRGHEYSEENTYVHRDGRRQCRECLRITARMRYHRAKACRQTH